MLPLAGMTVPAAGRPTTVNGAVQSVPTLNNQTYRLGYTEQCKDENVSAARERIDDAIKVVVKAKMDAAHKVAAE